ncbi:hypothetical protein IU421_00960 [Nocardia cyriacigeorgica]|uniref:toxin glutamine deamidase domain-containing protein n=1 Tax=Nocardia cyriacigeorgica TaxID=135487 RepID=UPI001893AF50|nr:toxin glutamine deamidase domain-containing protein [Nocardia cyriacigeorgica]MBF6512853.1 hypothetical protein [Nocardia cyriacigeorgica]
MGIEIPEALQWAAKYVVGAGDWPEGDETAMRRMADAYTTAATTLDDLGDDAQRQVNQLLSALDGQSADAIEAFWKKLGNNDGALSALTELLRNQADVVDDGANDIEHTKLMIIAQLVIFAVEMAAALAAMATGVGAPAGAAAGAAARVATQAAIRLTMRQLLQRILTRVVKEAALGALEEGGLDLGIRLIQAAKGDRELSRDDFTAVWQSAAGGAIGGAISGGLGREGGLTNGVGETAGEGLGNAVGNRAKQFATDYTTEVASDIGSQAAMAAITGEEFELSADTFTSAAAGAAQNQFDRGGNDSGGGDEGPENGPNNDPESENNNPDRGENNNDHGGNDGERSGNDGGNQNPDSAGNDGNQNSANNNPGNQTSPANANSTDNPSNGNRNEPPASDQSTGDPATDSGNQPNQTSPANADNNNDSGNGNEPPARTQPASPGAPDNGSGSTNNDTNSGSNNQPPNQTTSAATEGANPNNGTHNTPPANEQPQPNPNGDNNSGNGNEPPARTQPDDPTNAAGNNNPTQTSSGGDSNTPNSPGDPDAGGNHPPAHQPSPTSTDGSGDQSSGTTNAPADQPRSPTPTADEPGNTTAGDNPVGTGAPAQPSSLDLPTQDPSAPQSTHSVQDPNSPDLPPQDTSAGPTQPNQWGTPQQAPTEPGTSTQQNQSPSTGAQPTSPTTPTTPSAPAFPGDPSQSRPNSTTAPDSPSATQPSQSAPTAPANQPSRPGDQTQDTPAGSLDLPGQDSPTASPGQAPSPLDLPSQDPAPSQEPTPLDLPPQDPAPSQEPSPLDLPPQDPAPTREPTPLDLPDQNPTPGRADDPLNLPDQDGQPTQAPRPLDLPPQDAPAEQTPSPLDLPDPNSPTDPDAQSTTGAPLTTVAPANTTAAAATATAPTLDGGAQSNSPSATGTPTPTSTPPASPQSPTPTTQPGPNPQAGGTTSTRPTPPADGPARPTTPRRNDPGTQTNSPSSTGSDTPTSTTPPSPQPADTHATPPPTRPGYDPTIHKYVAHFNDGRPIPRDPFFAGEYNPHIGRYQPTEAEFQAERAQLAANPPESAAPEHNPPTSDHTRPDPTSTTAAPTRTEFGSPSGPAASFNDGAPATGVPTGTSPASSDLHDFTNLEAHRARTQLPSWWPNPARDQANSSPASGPSTTNQHHQSSTFPDARAPESTPPAGPTRNEPSVAQGHPHSTTPSRADLSTPPSTTTPQSTAPQAIGHSPEQHRDPGASNPGRTHNPIPNTHPHSPPPRPHPHTQPPNNPPRQTPADQARAARQFYRNQPPVDGRVTRVPSNHTGRPAYEIRRHRLPSGEHVSVLTVRAHLAQGQNVAPADLQRLMRNTEYAIDHSFNTAPQLLGGDRLLVDVEFTSNPADAHIQAGTRRGIGDLANWSVDSSPAHLTDNLRLHLGFTPSMTDDAGFNPDELRRLSNDIAAANTDTHLSNPSETRVESEQRLAPVEDPAYQEDVEDALRNGNEFTVGADPRTHPYGRLINDGGPTVIGRSNNCLDCSLSALSSFYGNPQVSAPRWPDELPDGTIDRRSGEEGGPSRAAGWLNSSWNSHAGNGVPIADQFAELHNQVAAMGPGSSALVINEWAGGGSHATVIVYPPGASGPVWWDAQSGATSDTPPAWMTDNSTALWSIPISPDQGANNAGSAIPHQGASGTVPGADLPEPGADPSGDGVRMGGPSGPEPGTASERPGSGPRELRGEQADRGDNSAPESASESDRGGVRPSDQDRPADSGVPGIPTDLAGPDRTDSGNPGGDRVPRPSQLSDPTPSGTPDRSPTGDQQTNPRDPNQHPSDPPNGPARDSMDSSPQPPERSLAPDRDVRVLDGQESDRSQTAASPHGTQIQPDSQGLSSRGAPIATGDFITPAASQDHVPTTAPSAASSSGGPTGHALERPTAHGQTHTPGHLGSDGAFDDHQRDAGDQRPPELAEDHPSELDVTREQDFSDLTERNHELRAEGITSVDELRQQEDPDAADLRKPHERTLTTLRYRTLSGEVVNLHGFSGPPHDWRPADETPDRPHKNRRLFETKDAAGYGRDYTSHRTNDSEVKLLEEVVRLEFERLSGLSRHEVDVAIQRACKEVANDVKFQRKEYPSAKEGEIMRTVDRIQRTVDEINKIGKRNADRAGTGYSPFALDEISGRIRMVVDLPVGRDDPPETQVCESCQDVMEAFEIAFPGIQIEVRNLAQEELY